MNLLIVLKLLVLPCLVVCAGVPYGNQHHYIQSPQLSSWGDWGNLQKCPSDQVVVGMKLKVHAHQGVKDDTGLNGVKFYCQNPYSTDEYSEERVGITSLVGDFGEWKKDFLCPPSTVPSGGPSNGAVETKLIGVGFQLRSETSAGVKDDTAGNNLRLVCSDLYQRLGYTHLEGDGTQRGEWTDRQLCWPGYAICGLQTQVETSRGLDTTGLNNIKVICCRVDSKIQSVATTNESSSDGHGSSSSSSSSSAESSGSGEKDNHNQENVGHEEHRSDHGTMDHGTHHQESHEEETHEAVHTELEQELIARVDPQPIEENDESSLTDADGNRNADVSLNSNTAGSEVSSSSNVEHDNNLSKEDDTLPEEIAKIDQVDNSEANHEDSDENISTATDSQQRAIPEDIINVLADADADTAKPPSSTSDENKQFHLGTEGRNVTDLNEISGIDEVSNSLEEEPKSSPRFGKIGANGTSADANYASKPATNQFTLVSMFALYYICKLIV